MANLFNINTKTDIPQISAYLFGFSKARTIWETYPKSKIKAMNLIQYALYMTDLSELNPYSNVEMVGRSEHIQYDMFGRLVEWINSKEVQALLKQFRVLASKSTLHQRVYTAKLGVAKIRSYLEKFNTDEATIEEVKMYGATQLQMAKNEDILQSAEQALTDSLLGKIELAGKDGQQYYD